MISGRGETLVMQINRKDIKLKVFDTSVIPWKEIIKLQDIDYLDKHSRVSKLSKENGKYYCGSRYQKARDCLQLFCKPFLEPKATLGLIW
jgi:hypothetical protein